MEVTLYIAHTSFFRGSGEVVCAARAEEIAACQSEQVRWQKHAVWKLLEHALAETYGLDVSSLVFRKEGERWRCAECEFSLSHSGEAVAVALSRGRVGIDLERCGAAGRLGERILTEREKNTALGLAEEKRDTHVCVLWTKKEAIFKCGNDKVFVPRKIEGDALPTLTFRVYGMEKYFLSVAAKQDFTVRTVALGNDFIFEKI